MEWNEHGRFNHKEIYLKSFRYHNTLGSYLQYCANKRGKSSKETGEYMTDENLQTFVKVVKRYYPEKEIRTENNSVWVNGYLASLLKCLLLKGYEKKFTFIEYLIEYVKYTEALETTENFIDDLSEIGLIYPDPDAKDLYRVTEKGFKVLEKVHINER